MVRNVLLVAWRDFLAVVRTKGFVIGLVFMPTVIAVSSQLPKLFKRFGEEGVRRFAVVDFTGQLAGPIEQRVAVRNAEPDRKVTIEIERVDVAAMDGAAAGDAAAFAAAKEKWKAELSLRAQGGDDLDPRRLYGFLLIGPRVLELPGAVAPHAVIRKPDSDDEGGGAPAKDAAASVTYCARSLTAGDLRDVVSGAVRDAVRTRRLEEAGLDVDLVQRAEAVAGMEEMVIGKKPGDLSKASGPSEAIVPMVAVFLLLMGVMQSAGMLLNSTIEEKSNRVVEVLVSSIRPFELLAGKIFGAWLTGLVLLLAWGTAGYFAADSAQWIRPGMFSGANVAWFAYFFLFGYLLFASLYAAVGAMCTSIQDAQSFMFPIVILIMIPMMSLGFVLNQPDSMVARVLTWFPFSAPFIAILRLTLSPPAPQWQIAVAAVSVAIGAWFLMWMGGKVFRIAIFSTGKPPRLGEIWRWLREA
jgi:ABC-type Na+ efflux pump permease subunit